MLIGDTYLATNQNLESATGRFAENIEFWRWLLPRVTDREAWIPPNEDSAPSEVAP